mmetsp:Transcript_19472/g.55792  ORF Transcript_19472/g.55792 Transcript_19472/m.55792 type:complete len:223 (+) Transcript_19472:20-688(+)
MDAKNACRSRERGCAAGKGPVTPAAARSQDPAAVAARSAADRRGRGAGGGILRGDAVAGRRPGALVRQVHPAHDLQSGLQLRARASIDRLLATHGGQHDCVVCLNRLDVLGFRLEGRFGIAHRLHALAQAIVGNLRYDHGRVRLLGVRPPRHLVQAQGCQRRRQLLNLLHSLRDRGASLLQLRDKLRVVEDTARHLAMTAWKSERELQVAFRPDAVLRQRAP